MNRTIIIELRNVYGRENMYVISEHAKFIQCLTNKKTIDEIDIKALKGLGFEVEVANYAALIK